AGLAHPLRPGRDVRPARGIRGGPGQWWLHRVLGRRGARPGPLARPAPGVRGVLAEVRTETTAAPHLAEPDIVRAESGSLPAPVGREGVDVYAWPHNETSTGVMAPIRRPQGAGADQLVLIDATSAAGGVAVDVSE